MTDKGWDTTSKLESITIAGAHVVTHHYWRWQKSQSIQECLTCHLKTWPLKQHTYPEHNTHIAIPGLVRGLQENVLFQQRLFIKLSLNKYTFLCFQELLKNDCNLGGDIKKDCGVSWSQGLWSYHVQPNTALRLLLYF